MTCTTPRWGAAEAIVERVESIRQIPSLLATPRAIVLLSVPWSPWPRKSRDVLSELERSREAWFPGGPVGFFDLWSEGESELNEWYWELCDQYPHFELHGHGYGPLWWLSRGVVLGCLTKPYEQPLASLQQRSQSLFHQADDCD